MLEHSRPLILDPLAGRAGEVKHITDPNLRGTLKELAQLDGAFVISDTGVVVSTRRYWMPRRPAVSSCRSDWGAATSAR